MQDDFVKLTSAVYRILDYFPEGDPLKYKTKEKVLVLMENLISKKQEKNKIVEDIDILLGCLQIGKDQGWLNSLNSLIVINEYQKIKNGFLSVVNTEGVQKRDAPSFVLNFPKRQKIILDFLSKNEKAQVVDLQKVLPEVTKRTIRRDLDELLAGKRISRSGEFNQIFYKILDRTR